MLSPSLLEKLGILQMNDQGGSWMTRMSKSILVFKMLSMRVLFF